MDLQQDEFDFGYDDILNADVSWQVKLNNVQHYLDVYISHITYSDDLDQHEHEQIAKEMFFLVVKLHTDLQ